MPLESDLVPSKLVPLESELVPSKSYVLSSKEDIIITLPRKNIYIYLRGLTPRNSGTVKKGEKG